MNPSQTTSMGDGIGLSFVKYLVELHGGYVRLESEPGKGTKFILGIPVCEGNEEVESTIVDERENELAVCPVLSSEQMNSSSPAALHTILLIDDEPEILE